MNGGLDNTIPALGRMPAEWEPHAATWLSWPHNPDTWPAGVAAAEQAMVAAVAALGASETVRINVIDGGHATHVRRLLAPVVSPTSFVLHEVPTNDAWIRDHGAIFVQAVADESGPLLALDFEYNAWGGKYPPFDLDRQVARRMAEILGVERIAQPMVLEGGSLDVNGAGVLLTTTQCLLNPNRNPRMSQDGIEALLGRLLGIEQFIWLGDGIEGDDTDGHVDDISRFVAAGVVVTAVETHRADPNYAPLAANKATLEQLKLADGQRLEVIDLPMPAPLFAGSQRLPASYANFYVANNVVLLPVFDCPRDEEAFAVLRDCFPSRQIVPIDCRALVGGLGAFHCLTQQVPAAGRSVEVTSAA